jgi:hypothetical protein
VPRAWTTTEVASFLAWKNVPADAYSFYAQRDDAICLDKIDDEWLVYFSERGTRRELAWADSEAQALDYLRLIVLEAHQLR